jgi:hypothetical protein
MAATKTSQTTIIAVLADLARGITAAQVAANHGLSIRTVMRIKADTKPLKTVEIRQEATAAAVTSWIDKCQQGIDVGIDFLVAVTRRLNTEKASMAEVRLVSECVVRTLSEVANSWKQLEAKISIEESKRSQPIRQDTTVATLSDAELVEAARALGSPQSQPPGEPN